MPSPTQGDIYRQEIADSMPYFLAVVYAFLTQHDWFKVAYKLFRQAKKSSHSKKNFESLGHVEPFM